MRFGPYCPWVCRGWFPYTARQTVASVVRDKLGRAQAQAQLSHAQLATTERHYLQRQTHGPDTREAPKGYFREGRTLYKGKVRIPTPSP